MTVGFLDQSPEAQAERARLGITLDAPVHPETVLVPDESVKRAKRPLTVVTSSELQTWRDCGYKWGLAYAEGLRPAIAHRALSFGTAVHAGLAAAEHETNVLEAAPSGKTAMKRIQGEWYAKVASSNLSGDEMDELAAEADESEKFAEWMVEHYVETFAEDWRYLVPLAIEQAFTLRAQNAVGQRVGHLAYAGVWDLVAYDRRYGDIVVMDHKTTSGNVDAIDRRVELDPQIAGYVWAVRRSLWHADVSIGETLLPLNYGSGPGGALRLLTGDEYNRIRARAVATGRVVYNVLRKKRPSEPKVNQDGLVSAAAIDTFGSKYREALDAQRDVRGHAWTSKQVELLAKLEGKGDTFLSRREFHRSDEEIERWRRELFVDAQRLRSAEANPDERTRNPGHCTMPWSMSCAYRRPCLDPQMTEGFVVTPRHVEVEEAKQSED